MNLGEIDDNDLIDENALLEEEDLKKPEPMVCGVPSDGEAKKRRACKNCTCGLAEQLESETASQAANQVKSSCGSVSNYILCFTLK